MHKQRKVIADVGVFVLVSILVACSSKEVDQGKKATVKPVSRGSVLLDSLISLSIIDLPSQQGLDKQISEQESIKLWKDLNQHDRISNVFIYTVQEGEKRIPKLGKLIKKEFVCDTCISWMSVVNTEGAESEVYTLFNVQLSSVNLMAHPVGYNDNLGDKVGFSKHELELALSLYRYYGNEVRIDELRKELDYASKPNEILNQTDSDGLKQGKWIIQDGGVKTTCHYKDDKLHGNRVVVYGAEKREQMFVDGKKHGYFKHYMNDTTISGYVAYYENNEQLWRVFKYELEAQIIPEKGWLTERDSVEIIVYYDSGELLYKGLITNEDKEFPATGKHYAYFKSGRKRASIDYDTHKMYVFEEDGSVVFAGNIIDWQAMQSNMEHAVENEH